MPDWYAKKSKQMYKKEPAGNTIIRKKFRQHRCYAIRQQISTYLIHIRKDYFHIDTRFFTASFLLFLIVFGSVILRVVTERFYDIIRSPLSIFAVSHAFDIIV